jgi:predicted nucleotidyltransferase
MKMRRRPLFPVLRALAEAKVDFVLVGGLAAVLNGAPVHTFDLDIVHSRKQANMERLLAVLDVLDAVFRAQPERRLKPTLSHLSGPGRLNLLTRFGPLDVLGSIGRGLVFEDLLPDTVRLDIGSGITIRALTLEKLIKLKEELGGEKDRAVLPILRRTLREKERGGR